jgi:hypothetical protein
VETRGRREWLLGGVAVALAALAYAVYVEWPGTSTVTPATSNQQEQGGSGGRADRRGRSNAPADGAPDVHLDSLTANRPRPEAGRDLFRFKVKPPPPPPPAPPPRIPTPEEQAAAAAPPPPPPITLKFIGFVDSDSPGKRIAFLSDGRGAPMSAHEGDAVLGQYRVLRIGAESIEMSYLDGRGRQTIRLTGS